MTRIFHPAQAEAAPLPWDADVPAAPADPNPRRQRHDAFTEARKSVFLKALIKTGCLLDACRATGISAKTAYRHQDSDPRFAAHCRAALRMSATPLELSAWTRAVEGVEREFACGGQVYTRRLYSDSLLRLLLQGSNPKKYGARPGFSRKRMATAERKYLRREIEAELRYGTGKGAPERSFPEVVRSIMTKVEAINRHEAPQKLAAGWSRSADGLWVPPGYGWVGLPPGWTPPAAEPPGESM
ncbi:MAG TPA: hypothetical protein VMG08_09815 [Allosphingosinicella sp.]|nr:hypothetical protein [Allosphingosinicella sp.]